MRSTGTTARKSTDGEEGEVVRQHMCVGETDLYSVRRKIFGDHAREGQSEMAAMAYPGVSHVKSKSRWVVEHLYGSPRCQATMTAVGGSPGQKRVSTTVRSRLQSPVSSLQSPVSSLQVQTQSGPTRSDHSSFSFSVMVRYHTHVRVGGGEVRGSRVHVLS